MAEKGPESSESEAPDAEWISPLDAVAHSVGTLCQKWSLLEAAIRKLLRRIARMPDDPISDFVLRCIDFRDQLTAIKVGVSCMMIPDTVVEEVIGTVDYIDNTLRPRRNRLVHDQWLDERGALHANRMAVAPKVIKPQSRKRREVRLDMEAEDIGDIMDSYNAIGAHARYVTKLAKLLEAPTGRSFRELLKARPERPLFRPPPETQRPAGKRETKPPPPPQS
jgi:hypothetical protein